LAPPLYAAAPASGGRAKSMADFRARLIWIRAPTTIPTRQNGAGAASIGRPRPGYYSKGQRIEPIHRCPLRSRGHRPATRSGHHRRRSRRDFAGPGAGQYATAHDPAGKRRDDFRRQDPGTLRRLDSSARLISALTRRGCDFSAAARTIGRLVPAARRKSISKSATRCPTLAGRSGARRSERLPLAPPVFGARRDPGSTRTPGNSWRPIGAVLPLGQGGVVNPPGSSSARCAAACCRPFRRTLCRRPQAGAPTSPPTCTPTSRAWGWTRPPQDRRTRRGDARRPQVQGEARKSPCWRWAPSRPRG